MNPNRNLIMIFVLITGLSVPVVYNGCSQSPFSAAETSTASVNNNSEQNLFDPDANDPAQDPLTPADDNGTDDGGNTGNPNQPPPPSANSDAPAFVVSGHQGSSMYSCDGGLSWKGYRQATTTRCDSGIDCDHTANSNPEAITYGEDGFMISYGWGAPGRVEISDDGNNWDQVHSGRTFAGVAFGNGRYFLCERYQPLISQDGGTNWTAGGSILSTPYNQRQVHFVPHNGGAFISLSNSSNVVDLMISFDNGISFRHPTTLPSGCGEGLLSYNATTIVLLSQNLCVSMDGGDNWVATPLPNGINTDRSQHLSFDGEEFIAYGRGTAYHSVDGLNWRQSALTVNGQNAPSLNLRHVAYHPANGKFVGFEQGYNASYEQTQFYHSTDGVNWMRLDKSIADVPQSPHPFRGIAVGYLKNCN